MHLRRASYVRAYRHSRGDTGSAYSGSSGGLGDGGPATSAKLNGPAGVAVDGAGNLVIADADSNRIREVAG